LPNDEAFTFKARKREAHPRGGGNYLPFLATRGANADFYAPYQENARRWYKYSQERVPFVNHAIIHPPVDRDKPPNEVADVCCLVEKETDQGIIVSGEKVVATGSVLTNFTFVAHHGLIPVQDKKFAVVFIVFFLFARHSLMAGGFEGQTTNENV
jgi:aromatic ring hydroxylase